MASSWLSRRPHCRRLGGRGHCWRRASAKGILQLRVPTRRLCRAVMLRLARTDLGRMALGHSPRGGMLLTKAAFYRNVGKEDLASWDARLLSAAERQRRVSGEAGASINQRPGMLIDINAQIA